MDADIAVVASVDHLKTRKGAFRIALIPPEVLRALNDGLLETVNLNELTWNYDVYGRLIDRNDLGGRDYNYSYNPVTGQLQFESQDGGASTIGVKSYAYYANGQLREIKETGTGGQIFRYEYDAAGNRTMEEVDATDAGQQRVQTVTRTSYDSHNRISQVLQLYAMDNDLTLKEAALKLAYVTEAEFDRVVDPAKMVRPYVATE